MNEIVIPPESVLYFQESVLILKALLVTLIGLFFAVIIAPENDASR